MSPQRTDMVFFSPNVAMRCHKKPNSDTSYVHGSRDEEGHGSMEHFPLSDRRRDVFFLGLLDMGR